MHLSEQLTDKGTAPGKTVKESIHSGKWFHKPKHAHAISPRSFTLRDYSREMKT